MGVKISQAIQAAGVGNQISTVMLDLPLLRPQGGVSFSTPKRIFLTA